VTVPVLTRQLKLGVYGKDVQAFRRAGLNLLNRKPPTAPLTVQRTFGVGMRQLVKDVQDDLGVSKTGVVGPLTMSFLRAADRAEGGTVIDAYAEQLFAQYAAEHPPKPAKPKLVEPKQGFRALQASLWPSFSVGRSEYGLSDLGVYNPSAANIAMGSDHAVYPAAAYDLGFTARNRAAAQAFFRWVIGQPTTKYAIFERSIWSRAYGLRRYTGIPHSDHVHVSGYR